MDFFGKPVLFIFDKKGQNTVLTLVSSAPPSLGLLC
eukprot:UN13057